MEFRPIAQAMQARQHQARQEREARQTQARQARQARQLQAKQARQLEEKELKKGPLLVIGGFKCATTTLRFTFRAGKSHELLIPIADTVTTILFPFRDNAEVYPSAFFQNIITPQYKYSIFGEGKLFKAQDDPAMMKIVLETPVEVLFTFFKNNISSFENALHLNNITRIREFNKTYGSSIDYLNTDIQTSTIVVNGIPRKLIAFDHRNLFTKFEELKMAIFSTPRPDIKLINHTVGSNKWYGPKYVEFMTLFNQEVQKKSRADQIKEGTTYLMKN